MININFCVAGISQIIRSIDKKWPINLDLMNRIHTQLDVLKSVNNLGFSLYSEPLRNEALSILNVLTARILASALPSCKISEFAKKIFDVKTQLVDAPAYAIKQVSERPKIELCLTFLCDFDMKDHNNAVGMAIGDLLMGSHPFVITRSLLKCSNVEDDPMKDQMWENEYELLAYKDRWDIFEKEGLLLFIPKSVLSEMTQREKLKALDFITDGTLKSTTVEKILQAPKEDTILEDFFQLFTKKPTIGKLFYLIGHGGLETVAALDYDHYQKFLDFLECQKCQGLTISSCYAGGSSSLVHLPRVNVGLVASSDQPKGLSFPVITRSIGDFPTKDDCYERDYDLYFKSLTEYLEDDCPKTHRTFYKMLDGIEDGSDEKTPANLVQVYFPHSAEAPGGFRAVGENKGYRLTVTKATQALLHFPVKERQSEIVIDDYNFVEVNPLVTQAPITFVRSDPVLLSMIPDDGHHLFHSIQLANLSPLDYLEKMTNFYRENEIITNKGFFIGELSQGKQTLKEVILHVNDSGSECLFQDLGYYFHYDGKVVTKISPFQYALRYTKILLYTTSYFDQAVRATSAGLESEESFGDALESRCFCSSNSPFSKWLNLLNEIYECNSILDLSWVKDLSEEEKIHLAFYLIEEELDTQAIRFVKSENLDVNSFHSLTHMPLIYTAVNAGQLSLVKFLLSKGANQNVRASNPSQTTPLHRAVGNDDMHMVELLLSDSNLDLNLKDGKGWNCLSFTKIQRIFDLLIKRGFKIDEPNNKGTTALGYQINLIKKVNSISKG